VYTNRHKNNNVFYYCPGSFGISRMACLRKTQRHVRERVRQGRLRFPSASPPWNLIGYYGHLPVSPWKMRRRCTRCARRSAEQRMAEALLDLQDGSLCDASARVRTQLEDVDALELRCCSALPAVHGETRWKRWRYGHQPFWLTAFWSKRYT